MSSIPSTPPAGEPTATPASDETAVAAPDAETTGTAAPDDTDVAVPGAADAAVPDDADAAAPGDADAPVPDDVDAAAPGDAGTAAPTAAQPGAAPARGTPTAADCARALAQRFPALFGRGAVKPMKLRIQADIQERAPGAFGKQALAAFFRRHTGSTAYLVALTRAPHRFDLDGAAAGELSDEHRRLAADELARRRAMQQAKIDQAEDGRRVRAALLRDFEATTLTRENFCALKAIAPQALDALLATARREADAQRMRQPPAPWQGPAGQRQGPSQPPGQGRRPDAAPRQAPPPAQPQGPARRHDSRASPDGPRPPRTAGRPGGPRGAR